MTRQKYNWQTSKRVKSPQFIKNRAIVRNRDQGCWIRCLTLHGRIVQGRDVYYFIPLAYGGTDDLWNLWLLCGPCHDLKISYESKDRFGFPHERDCPPADSFPETGLGRHYQGTATSIPQPNELRELSNRYSQACQPSCV